MKKKELATLTKLGSDVESRYINPSADMLETFLNPHPDREYLVEFKTADFSSLCPKTFQPDFAEVQIEYIPDKQCIETKSLKFYLLAYRQEGAFMEDVTNRILKDLVKACSPSAMTVTLFFAPRGGIQSKVQVSHTKE